MDIGDMDIVNGGVVDSVYLSSKISVNLSNTFNASSFGGDR
jgi:hypothetical protein